MSKILHRVIGESMPNIVSGSGLYLHDVDGRVFVDATGGAAVACLGHSHPKVLKAMQAQMQAVSYVHSGSFTTPVVEELGRVLAENAPDAINHTYLVSGGSEAVESALKLARQYHIEAGEPGRHHVIARRQSYHGNTFGALSASGHPARRRIYEPMLLPFHHVDPCYAYRHAKAEETPEAYALRAADSLEAEIKALGPETVAAFVAETVVGATLGAVTAEAGYFRRIREICDRYDVLLILDEVMAGMGRTGTLHAFEQEGIVPDMVVLAKGLAGGYQPIGAVMIGDRVVDRLARGSKAFQHGLTYSGHPVAAAAALAVQHTIAEEGLLENVTRMGHQLSAALRARFGDHPHVGHIRGRGLMQGIEFVADRPTKTPFDASLKVHERLKEVAMDLGLMIYPNGGCADGVNGDHMLIAPPFNVTGDEIDMIVDRVGQTVDRVFDEMPMAQSA
ncbi:MAG: aspartate aminotransferase family protein [Pseudomonadota bacterium]